MTQMQTTSANGAGAKTVADVIVERRDKLVKLLPPGVDPERFIQQAYKASQVPGVRACTPTSVLKCVADLAELGLDLSPSLGQAYLIPRFDKRVNAEVCTLLIGYRGLIAMMLRSPGIHAVDAAIVYLNDEFVETRGSRPELIHRPAPLTSDRGEVVGAYAIAYFTDSERAPQWAVMRQADLDRIRDRSQAGRSGPWQTDYEEMCRKTPIRRLAKYLPLAPEVSRIEKAIEVDRETEGWPSADDAQQPRQLEPAAKPGATKRMGALLGVARASTPEPIDTAATPVDDPAPEPVAAKTAAPDKGVRQAGPVEITGDDIPF